MSTKDVIKTFLGSSSEEEDSPPQISNRAQLALDQ